MTSINVARPLISVVAIIKTVFLSACACGEDFICAFAYLLKHNLRLPASSFQWIFCTWYLTLSTTPANWSVGKCKEKKLTGANAKGTLNRVFSSPGFLHHSPSLTATRSWFWSDTSLSLAFGVNKPDLAQFVGRLGQPSSRPHKAAPDCFGSEDSAQLELVEGVRRRPCLEQEWFQIRSPRLMPAKLDIIYVILSRDSKPAISGKEKKEVWGGKSDFVKNCEMRFLSEIVQGFSGWCVYSNNLRSLQDFIVEDAPNLFGNLAAGGEWRPRSLPRDTDRSP